MMYKLTFLLLGITACLAATQVSFTGNVSDPSSRGWQYRRTQLKQWPSPFGLGIDYTSVYVQRQGKSVSADVIYGACAFSTSAGNLYPPRTYVASFSGTDEWSGLGNYADGNVSAARGFIGVAYLALAETDSNGTFVKNASLGNNQMMWAKTDSSGIGNGANGNGNGGGNNDPLKWIVYTGTPANGDSWTISFTFIVSDVAGVINQGNATVTPTSIESIVNITGWKYQSPNNSLSMYMMVATGQSEVDASNHSLISGALSDGSRVVFGLANRAHVNDNSQPVNISDWTDGDINTVADLTFRTQLKARYQSEVSVKLVHVTFPPGAENISYDPTVSATTAPASTASIGSGVAAGTLLLSIVFSLLL